PEVADRFGPADSHAAHPSHATHHATPHHPLHHALHLVLHLALHLALHLLHLHHLALHHAHAAHAAHHAAHHAAPAAHPPRGHLGLLGQFDLLLGDEAGDVDLLPKPGVEEGQGIDEVVGPDVLGRELILDG